MLLCFIDGLIFILLLKLWFIMAANTIVSTFLDLCQGTEIGCYETSLPGSLCDVS